SEALIFEKFSRITGEGDGAGLGLAICREIMCRLGGEISFLRDVPGTAFRVQLPARALTAAA
ncbi:ATP-binding protein, partial [Sulfitobacter sp. M22298]